MSVPAALGDDLLSQKFRHSKTYSETELLRDLRDLAQELTEQLAEAKARIEALEAIVIP